MRWHFMQIAYRGDNLNLMSKPIFEGVGVEGEEVGT